MEVSMKDFASFVLISTATSMLLNPLRHPMFGAFNFNCTVLALESVVYVLLARTMPLRVHISSVSMFTILGYLISAVAYAFTSIVLDKFGISGLHTSIARLGLPSYLVNLLFISFFSYCWLQLPVSVVLQTYLSHGTAARSR